MIQLKCPARHRRKQVEKIEMRLDAFAEADHCSGRRWVDLPADPPLDVAFDGTFQPASRAIGDLLREHVVDSVRQEGMDHHAISTVRNLHHVAKLWPPEGIAK